jgi:hypothetical protein
MSLKYLKYVLSFLFIFNLISTSIYAAADEDDDRTGDRSEHQMSLNQRDLKSIREFLETKRDDEIMEKFRHLSFSGDVRSEWRHMTETMHGQNLRQSANDFDVEANLWTTYDGDRSWGVIQLQYDNSMGIDNNCCCCDCFDKGKGCRDGGCDDTPDWVEELAQKAGTDASRRFHGSGTNANINLKRAYLGWLIYSTPCFEFDVEFGRRPMYDAFESDLEFNARFDGVIAEAGYKPSWAKRAYAKLGAFVVDEKVNYYSWITELGLLNYQGFDIKYSFIDWYHGNRDRCKQKRPRGFEYMNSQFLVTYNLNPEWVCNLPTEVYGAVLFNHRAKHASMNNSSKGAWGWYTGVIVGEVEKKNDWSVELEYQFSGQNAVAYDDSNGIGVGDQLADFCKGPGPSAGFHGVLFDSLYAITDNLTIQCIVEVSRAVGQFPKPCCDDEDSEITFVSSDDSDSESGCCSDCKDLRKRRHHFSKVEIELAYAF